MDVGDGQTPATTIGPSSPSLPQTHCLFKSTPSAPYIDQPPLHLLLQLPPQPPPRHRQSQQQFLHGTFAQRCENGCGTASAATRRPVGGWIDVDDLQAQAVVDQLLHRHRPGRRARCRDLARAGGGLGEYYSERETRTPVWLLAGDTHTVAELVGLTDAQRAGGDADAEVVARWLDDGIAPNGARGRAFGAARCARVRSDVLRTQERLVGPGAAHR